MQSIDQSVLEAFDTMWGLYPEPVMLVHACRDVLAVNQRAEELGITPGIKCYSLYPSDRICPGCLGNKMLKSGQAERKGAFTKQGRYVDGYWIPVKGVEKVFVHFGNDITEFVKPELLAE
ncbi:hypothetical protein [Pseudodesulfovibrio methanolicus]|uniref:Uncharacterized protein n=1 Tax=Pseudodesulfovibrio methanolicus TaxID=3126690 RepID=A0ABZ2J5H9_9BACT